MVKRWICHNCYGSNTSIEKTAVFQKVWCDDCNTLIVNDGTSKFERNDLSDLVSDNSKDK